MKRGTPDHPKVLILCENLHCRRPTALGYLTLLWEFTANYAPQGDVGKYSDKWIEASLDWRGRSGVLIQALLKSGWLDTHEQHRYVIHDWSDHCEDSVRLRLWRHRLDFASGHKVTWKSKVKKTSVKEKKSFSESQKDFGESRGDFAVKPSPKPLPEPINKTPPAPPAGGVAGGRFTKRQQQAERFRADQVRRKELERVGL